MINFLEKYYYMIFMILGFILYWIFGITITYIVALAVIGFVIWIKTTNKIEMYNIDLVLFILYILLCIFALFISKNEGINILTIALGILYISSFYKNKRLKNN